MPTPELERLAAELGGNPPPAFDTLDDGALKALGAALRQARSRQRRLLDAALVSALEHVPALMRGPIRRILGL